MRARSGHWIIVWLIALGSRLTAAFLLPNPEQDGYSYAEIIARLSSQVSGGNLQLVDLFGFWFPLFPLTAAIPNVWIDNSLVAGKVLSALCGAGSCVIVFAIAQRISRSIALGYLALALIVFNPLHLLYSAACMTDVPSSFLVLASLWSLLRRRWVLAAIFAALAGCVRIEPWALILLFALADIRQDVDYFLLGANRIVVLAIIATAILSILRVARCHRLIPLSLAAPFAYAAALFGFLFLAYVTKRQPVILPRYG